jgi:tight adherence protein B
MNAFRAIFTTSVGFASVIIGGALLYAGRLWSNSMLAKATPNQNDAGAFLDAVAVALNSGLNVQEAVRVATKSYELQFETVDELALAELQKSIDLSVQSGAAIAPLLIATADRLRDAQNNATADRLARLSVRLMIPLGVAVLPAFVLMSIVPIAISLLTNK